MASRLAFTATVLATGALAAPIAASASPLDPSGVVRLHLNTNQSSNWFGYNQGTLEQGGTQFNAVTGDWTVPTATSHAPNEDESSATWIGIGGGCVDAGCTVSDVATLIQTGTEQDVDSSGHASYSAWWELIPVPAVTISNFDVSPGDHIHASVAEVVPGADLWTITLNDVTKNESFSTTVPYVSSHASAEWIEEAPLVVGGSSTGQATLPSLSPTPFDGATVNGAPANLQPSEEMQLVDSNNNVIGAPSAPDPEADGFTACAWATSCSVGAGGAQSISAGTVDSGSASDPGQASDPGPNPASHHHKKKKKKKSHRRASHRRASRRQQALVSRRHHRARGRR